MHSTDPRRRRLAASTAACGAALLIWVLPTGASASVYPTGGGAFATDAEGWEATEASCNVTALSTCEASGEWDAANGNPPGALTAKTNVLLNLAALLESTVLFESPDFTAAESGAGTVHVDRQFLPRGTARPVAGSRLRGLTDRQGERSPD
jgi:hypothetical protein